MTDICSFCLLVKSIGTRNLERADIEIMKVHLRIAHPILLEPNEITV